MEQRKGALWWEGSLGFCHWQGRTHFTFSIIQCLSFAGKPEAEGAVPCGEEKGMPHNQKEALPSPSTRLPQLGLHHSDASCSDAGDHHTARGVASLRSSAAAGASRAHNSPLRLRPLQPQLLPQGHCIHVPRGALAEAPPGSPAELSSAAARQRRGAPVQGIVAHSQSCNCSSSQTSQHAPSHSASLICSCCSRRRRQAGRGTGAGGGSIGGRWGGRGCGRQGGCGGAVCCARD
jgi:hypothetical protein